MQSLQEIGVNKPRSFAPGRAFEPVVALVFMFPYWTPTRLSLADNCAVARIVQISERKSSGTLAAWRRDVSKVDGLAGAPVWALQRDPGETPVIPR